MAVTKKRGNLSRNSLSPPICKPTRWSRRRVLTQVIARRSSADGQGLRPRSGHSRVTTYPRGIRSHRSRAADRTMLGDMVGWSARVWSFKDQRILRPNHLVTTIQANDRCSPAKSTYTIIATFAAPTSDAWQRGRRSIGRRCHTCGTGDLLQVLEHAGLTAIMCGSDRAGASCVVRALVRARGHRQLSGRRGCSSSAQVIVAYRRTSSTTNRQRTAIRGQATANARSA